MDKKCPGCGKQSFFVSEVKFDGFIKTGTIEKCITCGYVLKENEENPMQTEAAPPIFTEDDLPEENDLFDGDERPSFCRHCVHYLVNPFTQRCALHAREVQATDSCADFARKQ